MAENTAQTSKTKQNVLFYISGSSEIKVAAGAARNTPQDPVLSLTQALPLLQMGAVPPDPSPILLTSPSVRKNFSTLQFKKLT